MPHRCVHRPAATDRWACPAGWPGSRRDRPASAAVRSAPQPRRPGHPAPAASRDGTGGHRRAGRESPPGQPPLPWHRPGRGRRRTAPAPVRPCHSRPGPGCPAPPAPPPAGDPAR
ncbi:hypothetical protein G6F32_016816 [Rhizopus arrhizus]|nr:hypothetical protein G6F32_016816 [Rhizopus arrhizus]